MNGEGPLRVLVVDDEAPARERLRALLLDTPNVEVVGEAADGMVTLASVERLHPDVVLLDVRMPGMHGLEVASHLAQLKDPPAVIFITAYEQHALAAFDARVLDYLLKPVRSGRLEQALNRARQLRPEQVAGIAERTYLGDAQRLVPVSEIRLLRAEHKYVSVYFPDGELIIEDSLGNLESEFDGGFVRVHRNALVALAYISVMARSASGQWQLQVEGLPFIVEVSRRQAGIVRSRLQATRVSPT